MEQLRSRYQRYRLEDLIGFGGMGNVYRAYDRLNDKHIALKRLTGDLNALSFTQSVGRARDTQRQRMMLAQEFKILASLRHPHIVSVLDYGFDSQQQPYFIMELVPASQSILQAAEDQSREQQITYLTQLLLALDYLHRRDVIHRDLKPANVLVYNGQVKVVDFGLSQTIGTNTEELGGTVGYIPPEVLLGDDVTFRCDLYAFGVIAYEVISGRHPFFDAARQQFDIDAILTRSPDPTPLDGSPLQAVILRLLAKRPEESYRSVGEVITALYGALGRDIPRESVEIREGVLQSGRFVGRDVPLAQLMAGLEGAGQGKGAGFLVGGAGGVGKSRLLDEFRTQALVRGIPVVRGQATREQGALYKIWQDILREFCLLEDVATLLTDERAAVLKPVCPDLPIWLGRAIPDAPDINPALVNSRLSETLRQIFTSINQPLVIVLEDLHWLRDGLPLLKAISEVLSQSYVLLVATYRTDEAPRLLNQLPKMQSIMLEPLDSKAVYELTQSFVSPQHEVGGLAGLLTHETGGNAFLIVEIFRTLVDEIGLLKIASMEKIPTAVLGGGIRGIIGRRLSRLPADAIRLLQVGAVVGRSLDDRLLARVLPDVALDAAIQACTEALILEAVENRWRFAHDLVRETILAGLTSETLRELHGLVAQHAEALYHDRPASAARLAYHYWAAQNWDKARTWSEAAIAYARANHANGSASQAYPWLLDSLAHAPDSEETRLARLDALIQYDEVSALITPASERVATLRQAEQLAMSLTSLERIHKMMLIHIQFARLYFSLNDLPKALDYAYQSLASAQMLGNEFLLCQPWVVLGMLSTSQGEFTKAQDFFVQGLAIAQRGGNQRYWTLGHVYQMISAAGRGHPDEVDRLLTEVKAVVDVDTNPSANAQIYGALTMGAVHLGRWAQAVEYGERAMQSTRQTDDVLLDVLTMHFIAFAYMGAGDLVRAGDYLRRAQANLQTVNQEIFFRDVLDAFGAYFYHQSGQSDLAQTMVALGKPAAAKNGGLLAVGLYARIEAILHADAGRTAEAHAALDEARTTFKRIGALPYLARTDVTLGHLLRRTGDAPAAEAAFARAEAIFAQIGASDELESVRQLKVVRP